MDLSRFRMRSSLPRRQLLLFALAILLPCVVLVALGVRLVRQEWELADKRLTDQRRAAVADVRRELRAELERISAREAAALDQPREGGPYAASATVFVARAEAGRVLPPWDRDPRRAAFVRARNEPQVARLIAEAERAEHVLHDNAAAADIYRRAASVATHAPLAAMAEFLAARALASVDARAARAQLARITGSARSARDDEGVPIAVYAARRLLALGPPRPAEATDILALMETDLVRARELTPTACMMLRDLSASLTERAPSPDTRLRAVRARSILDARCVALTQAAMLASSSRVAAAIGEITRTGQVPDDVWWMFGRDPAWLVTVDATTRDRSPFLLAVHADSVLPRVSSADLQLMLPGTTSGRETESLGGGFEGVALRWTTASAGPEWTPQQSFYVLTLVVVIGVGVLGAYLVWRDLRRELGLAELRSQFVASVTHELKTPLTSIRLFAETLRDRPAADERARTEYLDTIISESERLTRLLNNVLEFSRIESGARSYRLELRDAADIVRAAARTMSHPLAQQGFKLNASIEDRAMPVRCDPDAIEQAVLNLLANALKFSGDGREIGLIVRRLDDAVTISVRDQGLGVPPGEEERIFEKFHRARTEENRAIPGAGLGLAIVQHVVTAHGGRVLVESELGRGSTFTIRLPLDSDFSGSLAGARALTDHGADVDPAAARA